jgi:hypothetical protein
MIAPWRDDGLGGLDGKPKKYRGAPSAKTGVLSPKPRKGFQVMRMKLIALSVGVVILGGVAGSAHAADVAPASVPTVALTNTETNSATVGQPQAPALGAPINAQILTDAEMKKITAGYGGNITSRLLTPTMRCMPCPGHELN